MNPNRRHPAIAAAILASFTTLGSVLALFHSASSAPRHAAHRAALAAAGNERSESPRSDCLRAAAAYRDATQLAAR